MVTGGEVSEAVEAFRADGWLQVDNVLSAEFLDELRACYLGRYAGYLAERDHDDALDVGHRRYMVTVELCPPFSAPEVYANSALMPVITALLGSDVNLFSFGSVVSLPGARAQHVHRDVPGLFADPQVDGAVPPYAITAIIPLVDMNDETGTTKVFPASHLHFGDGVRRLTSIRPLVRKGDVMLVDYRLLHAGTRNCSSEPRPVLYNVYARHWFNDVLNYKRQPPLVIGADALGRVPAEHRHLFPQSILERDRLDG